MDLHMKHMFARLCDVPAMSCGSLNGQRQCRWGEKQNKRPRPFHSVPATSATQRGKTTLLRFFHWTSISWVLLIPWLH